MADESLELCLFVRLDEKYDFVVVFPKTRTIGELREEVQSVAREAFPAFRGGKVLNIQNKSGSHLPDRYQVGKLLQNRSQIVCYSSDYQKSNEARKEILGQKKTSNISNSKRTSSRHDTEESSRSSGISDDDRPLFNKRKSWKMKRRRRKNKGIKGSKDNENAKKLSQTDKPSPTEAKEEMVAKIGKSDMQKNATKNQANTSPEHFVADMQEIENESRQGERLMRVCFAGVGKSLGKTQSGACGVEDDLCQSVALNKRSQQMKTSGNVRKKQSVLNMAAKHSLREAKGTVNHMHCRSSEVILSASKYKSLFTVPEHCRPKRKEAIETSASKVAEWLSTNDEPSEVDVQDTNSDGGTMDVDSKTEEGTSKQVEKDIEAETDGDEADDVDEGDVNGSHGDDVGSHGDGVGSPGDGAGSPGDDADSHGDDVGSHGDDVGHHDDVSSHGDDAGSHGEDKDIDNCDISVADGVNSSKQATANNTTTGYQQKNVSTMTDICVSASPSKSKRREGRCIHGVLRSSNETTVCGIPGTVLSPWDNKQNCLTKKRALLSSTGTCQVKIEKLPIDIKHGRNIRVEYSYHHQINKRPLHGDDMSNADNNCSAVQTENTLTKDNCLEIQRENENTATRGREIPSVKHKKVVRSSTGKVEKYLGSKDGIDNETARGEEMQQKRDLQTSAEESSGNEQDVHGAVSKENVENCEDVQTRQARQYLHENSTIKTDNDDNYDGDNDDEDEDEEIDDKITPDVYKNNTMTVDYGDEDRELSEQESETVLTVNCRVKDDMELKLPEQSVVTDKRKELETDAECNNNTRRDTCSAVKTTESPAQVKQVSAVETEWRQDDETEGENNDLTPIYLTPIKNGEQVVWLKKTSREGDSEQVGDDYEDFMNGLEMSDCNTTSHERMQSIREKTPLLSSETAKESEYDEEKSRENVNLRRNGRRKSMKAKKRSERRKRKLEGNEDAFVKHVEQESVSDRTVISTKTVEGNVEFEFVTQEPAEKRSEQKKRKLEGNGDTLVENINREDDRTTASNITLKENVKLECASQDPTEKRSEQKKRKLEENEDALVENVNQENDRTKASKITLEENVELEIATQDPTEKRSELKRSKGNKDTLVNGVHQENVTDKTTTSKKTMKETMEVQFASPEPTKRRFEQIKKKMEDDGNALVENVTQECVSDSTVDRKKSVETPIEDKHDYSEDEQNDDNLKSNGRKTNCQMEVNNMSDHLQEENQVHQSKKKKKKKKEKKRQHELSNTASTLETPPASPSVERVAVKEMNSISGQLLQGNHGNQIEMLKKSKKKKKEKRENSETSNIKSTTGTTTTPPSVERVAVKRKADEGVDLLQKPESEAFIGKKKSKKQVGKDSYCEDKQSKDNEKSIERETRNQVEGVDDTSVQHQEENHVYQVEVLKKSKKKRKEKKRKSELTETTNTSPSVERAALNRKADGRTDLLQKTESEASIGEKPTMKQAGKHSHWEDERDKDDEKSIDRKISNQVNSTCDQLQEGDVVNQSQKRKNKKDKRRKSKLCNTESTTETFAPPILEKVDSPNDSGFSENSRKKFKKNEQGMPEEGFVLNDPERPTSKGNKKKSKASSSLLDLALDDTADQKDSKTSHKTVSSEGRSNHHLARHFRQTPKGFLNSTKNRKITASTSSIIISRKPNTNWKEIQKQVEMTAKEKDLVTSRVSFEQLLDDESFWNT